MQLSHISTLPKIVLRLSPHTCRGGRTLRPAQLRSTCPEGSGFRRRLLSPLPLLTLLQKPGLPCMFPSHSPTRPGLNLWLSVPGVLTFTFHMIVPFLCLNSPLQSSFLNVAFSDFPREEAQPSLGCRPSYRHMYFSLEVFTIQDYLFICVCSVSFSRGTLSF